jgi:hypothetical protein
MHPSVEAFWKRPRGEASVHHLRHVPRSADRVATDCVVERGLFGPLALRRAATAHTLILGPRRCRRVCAVCTQHHAFFEAVSPCARSHAPDMTKPVSCCERRVFRLSSVACVAVYGRRHARTLSTRRIGQPPRKHTSMQHHARLQQAWSDSISYLGQSATRRHEHPGFKQIAPLSIAPASHHCCAE